MNEWMNKWMNELMNEWINEDDYKWEGRVWELKISSIHSALYIFSCITIYPFFYPTFYIYIYPSIYH